MPDLNSLAERARSDASIVTGLSMDQLERRAAERRNRKRTIAATLSAAVVIVAVAGVALNARRPTESNVGTNGPVEVPSSTTQPATSSTAPTSTTTSAVPESITAPAPTIPPSPTPPVPTSTAPTGNQLDAHGLSTDGLKPLTFGSSVAQGEQASGKKSVSVAGEMCGPLPVDIKDALPGVDLTYSDGKTLHYVVVRGGGVTTLSGIGIGTSVSTLLAKVPSAAKVEQFPSPRYVVFSPDHQRSIIFDADDSMTITFIMAGTGDLSTIQDWC